MIAKSFRSVGWVASVAAAALGCYLISQRVASERTDLEKMERNILEAKLDMRKLQTELDTRSRMGQLERWNSDVLALAAPTAGQYLHNDVALARFEAPKVEQQIVPVAYKPDHTPPAKVVPVAAHSDEPVPQPMLRHANYVRPADTDAAPVRPVALLDDHVLDSISRAAEGEGRSTSKAR